MSMRARKSAKISGRAKRKQDFLALNSKSELSLVSMMDIFTILVFFLLVSSSSQQLPNSKNVKLPTSVSQKVPSETVIVAVTRDSILVQGVLVANVVEVLGSPDDGIKALEDELRFQSSKLFIARADTENPRAVTIVGDETIPYALIRKILASCREANYLEVAFAAHLVSKGKT
jgi:biopolymer transport protein TolR